MVFPATKRIIKTEIYVTGKWVDITTDVDVRNNGFISITRGARDEQNRPSPQTCALTIDNRSGNYSPRNPVGIYYGSIGRNTPLRVTVILLSDTFTRTASSSWGTSDTGQTYTLSGSSVLASYANVAAGVGTLSVPSANNLLNMTPSGITINNVDVTYQVTLPFTNVTGASIGIVVKLRDAGGSNYTYVPAFIKVDRSVTLGIVDNTTGTFIATETTIAGLTFSGQQLSIRAQADGQTYRAKVWATASGEPYAWQAAGHSTTTPTGAVSVQAWVLSGNTNTAPVVFSIDNLTIGSPRFFGEIPSWPQRWDITGRDTYIPIQGSGLKRRLIQGALPVKSALYRYHTRLATPPVAYWPGEDLPNGDFLLKAAIGAFNMSFLFGVAGGNSVNLAADNTVVASAPLAIIGTSTLYNPTTFPQPGITLAGGVGNYVTTNQVMLRFIIRIPVTAPGSPEPQDNSFIGDVDCSGTGTVGDVGITYRTGGLLGVAAAPPGGGAYYFDSGAIGFPDIRGRTLLMSLQLAQSGSDVTYSVSVLEVGQTGGIGLGGTITGKTLGSADFIDIDAASWLHDFLIGHISVRKENVAFADIQDPLMGYRGETAGTRIARLCAEENINCSYRGNLTTTTGMGPQGAGAVTSGQVNTVSLTTATASQTILDLLYECEDVDIGILYEPRGDIGLAYLTRIAMYGQPPVFTLDYSLGQVAPPLEPTDDDLLTQNDILATNVNAGSALAQLTSGRMSILPPEHGGVGDYPVQLTLNAATDGLLAGIAAFRLGLGTVDEARFPVISVNLANPDTVTAGIEAGVLDAEIGDRMVITKPKAGLTDDQISQIIRGYTETLRIDSHILRFNCSPATPYTFVRPDAGFKVDSVTSTLVSSITSTATAMSVANINEPWTTDPVQMPIPIVAGGEVMNVTAISGASSPQTFTVVRSINGVVKAQTAGTVVQVSRPSRPIVGL